MMKALSECPSIVSISSFKSWLPYKTWAVSLVGYLTSVNYFLFGA